jgi:hypothetical protein
MAKGGLSNQLIGKLIQPRAGVEHIWDGMQKNLSGELLATIDAAWTEDGLVKVAAHDPYGNLKEFWLTNVRMVIGPHGE